MPSFNIPNLNTATSSAPPSTPITCVRENQNKLEPSPKAHTDAPETLPGQPLPPPVVYYTKDVTPDNLLAIYQALQRPAHGKVAIKLHMGEPNNHHFLSPELLRPLVCSVHGTFVDCNTYYGGARDTTEGHLQVANQHGFSYAPVDILDSDGDMMLPVPNGKHIQEAIVGSHYANYDFLVSLAHFKGHNMAGFGGTFKNLAVGLASRTGKAILHADNRNQRPWACPTDVFLEKIAEYTLAIVENRQENILFINVLNNLSDTCDCEPRARPPLLADLGILASLDPVALDRASVDLVLQAPTEQNQALVRRIKSRQGLHLLDYAGQIGLGQQNYRLVTL